MPVGMHTVSQVKPNRVHAYMHTYIPAYIHTHIHTYIYTNTVSTLTVTVGMHTMAQVVSRHALSFSDLCVPHSLKSIIRTVDSAVNLLQLAYDPNRVSTDIIYKNRVKH
jgi:hypothetical protein